ncbi:MAG TPA: hypothetical protein VN426_07405 [Syntrophomonadaceae bacterium]|nr:hypothetical protein [Syntrophomonadaceae bacterium]
MNVRRSGVLMLLLLISCLLSSCTPFSKKTDAPIADTGRKIEKTIKAGQHCTFAVPSGDGVFTVSFLDGSFVQDMPVTMTCMAGKIEGIVSPGFLLEQTGRPNEHVFTSLPATIIYLQKEPIPDDVSIVKYSDDRKSYTPVFCQRVKINGNYGLYSVTDSFSPVGIGRVTKEQIKAMADEQLKNGFVWVLEASEEFRLTNKQDAESLDVNLYMKATSRKITEDPTANPNSFEVKGYHYGIFDMNTFAVAKEKGEFDGQELPITVGLRYYDNNLKIRIVPEFKPVEKDNDVLAPLVPDDGMLAPLIAPEVIGYKGWGVIHLNMEGFAVAGEAKASMDVAIPVVLRIKESVARIYFTFPNIGAIQLKGRYLGKGVKEAAQAPKLQDPKTTYSPGKPEKPPISWEGLDPNELLAPLTQNSDGSIIEKSEGAGGSTVIEYEPDKTQTDNSVPPPEEVCSLFSELENMTTKMD